MTTLYIIGNGLGLFHKLPTDYTDYHQYLISNYPDVAKAFNSFPFVTEYQGQDASRWSSIEQSMELAYDEFLENALSWYPLDLSEDNPGWDDPAFFISTETEFLLPFTAAALHDWVASINLNNASNDVLFDDDSAFVTFNYTELLEKRYRIPRNRILHIHGSLDDRSSAADSGTPHSHNLQFGSPANDPQILEQELEQTYGKDDYYGAYIKPCVIELEKACHTARKKLSDNYDTLMQFLENWRITGICIFGHNCSGIDFPYYKDIILPRYRTVPWRIITYGLASCEEAKSFLHENGVSSYQVIDDKGMSVVDARLSGKS